MLSDFKREVSRLYGVLDEEKYFSRRAYFLIDKAGCCAGGTSRRTTASGARWPSCSSGSAG